MDNPALLVFFVSPSLDREDLAKDSVHCRPFPKLQAESAVLRPMALQIVRAVALVNRWLEPRRDNTATERTTVDNPVELWGIAAPAFFAHPSPPSAARAISPTR